MKIYFDKTKFTYSSELALLRIFTENVHEPHHSLVDSKDRAFCMVENALNIQFANIQECDFVVLPYKFRPDAYFKSLCALAQTHNKRVICFFNDDYEQIIDVPSHVTLFRTSMKRSQISVNQMPLAPLVPDWNADGWSFTKLPTTLPSIGFCGAVHHGRKQHIVHLLANAPTLKPQFILRTGFWAPGVPKDRARKEYIDNIVQNTFTLCYRGAGNFSYRFYEVLSLGRIPIFIDADTPVPWITDKLFSTICVYIKDIKEVEEAVHKFCTKYMGTTAQILQTFQRCRYAWMEYFSAEGFSKHINQFMQALGDYK